MAFIGGDAAIWNRSAHKCFFSTTFMLLSYESFLGSLFYFDLRAFFSAITEHVFLSKPSCPVNLSCSHSRIWYQFGFGII
jgi:hypothetical protein